MHSTNRNAPSVDLSTLEQLPVAAALFDNNEVFFLNNKAFKLFRFPKKEIGNYSKLNIFKFLNPQQQKRVKQNNIKIIKGAKLPSAELDFVDFNGNSLFLEINSNSVLFNGKKVIQSTFTEITERKKTENLLNETKEKFELIANNSNDIISFYTYTPKEKYLYVSPNIKKILGYKPEELTGDFNFFNKKVIGNKGYFLRIDSYLRNLQKKNICKNYNYSFKTIKKNNEEVWLENSIVPIQNKSGKIEFFLNVLRDVTDHKEKELELQSQYSNYQNLLDNSQVAYAIHNQGILVYCNKELLNLLKAKNKRDVLGKFAADFFCVEDRKKIVNRIKEVYKTKKLNEPHTYHLLDSKGNKVEVEIRSNLIKYNNNTSILSSILNISKERQAERERVRSEITELNNKILQKEIEEKQLAEQKLIERTGRLTSILENTSHLIWTIDKDKQIVSFNKNFQKKLYEKYGYKVMEGDRVDKHLKRGRKEYVDYWYPKYDRVFKGESLEFEREDLAKNKEKVYRKIFINPIVNKAGKVIEASCIAHDITQAKVYEQKLYNQAAKLNSIFDSSHHYIWTIDSDEKLTSFNKNYFDLISTLYNTHPYIGLVLNRGILSNNKEYNNKLKLQYKKAFNGEPTNFVIETIDKNYKKIFLDIFLNPIEEDGKVVEVSGIAHDVTEKNSIQQSIEQSLKEKEVLLKEVHHRVKNNMQVISSILNLQSSYVSDEYTLSLLKESQNRIKTMAYIHESIYQNKSFTSVNFSDYLATLSRNVIQSYAISDGRVKLELNLEKINLSLDNSIPAGLIINELITNAVKHAFIKDANGLITINLKSENNAVYLEVKDNGTGFDSGIDFKNTNTLGLQLVNTLVDQIDGELSFKSEKGKGSRILIKFKM